MAIDPYAILGVAKDAAATTIRSSYKKLMLQCHPDKVHDESQKAARAAQFEKVQEAYELLSDSRKRKKYDEELANGKSGGQAKSTGSGGEGNKDRDRERQARNERRQKREEQRKEEEKRPPSKPQPQWEREEAREPRSEPRRSHPPRYASEGMPNGFDREARPREDGKRSTSYSSRFPTADDIPHRSKTTSYTTASGVPPSTPNKAPYSSSAPPPASAPPRTGFPNGSSSAPRSSAPFSTPTSKSYTTGSGPAPTSASSKPSVFSAAGQPNSARPPPPKMNLAPTPPPDDEEEERKKKLQEMIDEEKNKLANARSIRQEALKPSAPPLSAGAQNAYMQQQKQEDQRRREASAYAASSMGRERSEKSRGSRRSRRTDAEDDQRAYNTDSTSNSRNSRSGAENPRAGSDRDRKGSNSPPRRRRTSSTVTPDEGAFSPRSNPARMYGSTAPPPLSFLNSAPLHGSPRPQAPHVPHIPRRRHSVSESPSLEKQQTRLHRDSSIDSGYSSPPSPTQDAPSFLQPIPPHIPPQNLEGMHPNDPRWDVYEVRVRRVDPQNSAYPAPPGAPPRSRAKSSSSHSGSPNFNPAEPVAEGPALPPELFMNATKGNQQHFYYPVLGGEYARSNSGFPQSPSSHAGMPSPSAHSSPRMARHAVHNQAHHSPKVGSSTASDLFGGGGVPMSSPLGGASPSISRSGTYHGGSSRRGTEGAHPYTPPSFGRNQTWANF